MIGANDLFAQLETVSLDAPIAARQKSAPPPPPTDDSDLFAMIGGGGGGNDIVGDEKSFDFASYINSAGKSSHPNSR